MTGGIVTGVDPDSPAAHASLQPGDIVAGADGTSLPDARAVLRFILVQPPGKPVTLAVWRDDQMTNVTVTGQPWPHIMARREDVLASAAAVARLSAEGIGARVTAITAANRAQYDLKDASGVVIDQVIPGTQADEMGLKAGDVVEQVDNHKTPEPDVLASQLRYGAPAGSDLIALLVRNAGTSDWVTLYVGDIEMQALISAPSGRRSLGNRARCLDNDQCNRLRGHRRCDAAVARTVHQTLCHACSNPTGTACVDTMSENASMSAPASQGHCRQVAGGWPEATLVPIRRLVKLKNGEPDMKFITIGGVAAAALALGTVAAFAQATDSPSLTFKPPPAGYNNSTVGPASSNQSNSTRYTQGTKPPPAGYNDRYYWPGGIKQEPVRPVHAGKFAEPDTPRRRESGRTDRPDAEQEPVAINRGARRRQQDRCATTETSPEGWPRGVLLCGNVDIPAGHRLSGLVWPAPKRSLRRVGARIDRRLQALP